MKPKRKLKRFWRDSVLRIAAVIAMPLAAWGGEEQPSGADGTPGRITNVIGTGSLSSGQSSRSVRPGMPLNPGDTLTTDTESRCEIVFPPGRTVRINEKTTIVYDSCVAGAVADAPSYVLRTMTGSVWVNVRKLAGAEFRLHAPTALAAIRGTSYNVDCSKNASDILVFSGTVDASPRNAGPAKAKPVSAGTRYAVVRNLEEFIEAERKAYEDFAKKDQEDFQKFMEQEMKEFGEVAPEYARKLDKLRSSFTKLGGYYVGASKFDAKVVGKREWIKWNREQDKK